MKRIRIVGLCLIATFAISIVASSVASAAQPVFYTKAEVGGSAPSVGACVECSATRDRSARDESFCSAAHCPARSDRQLVPLSKRERG